MVRSAVALALVAGFSLVGSSLAVGYAAFGVVTSRIMFGWDGDPGIPGQRNCLPLPFNHLRAGSEAFVLCVSGLVRELEHYIPRTSVQGPSLRVLTITIP